MFFLLFILNTSDVTFFFHTYLLCYCLFISNMGIYVYVDIDMMSVG